MPFTPQAHPGILHHYAARLVAFEYERPSSPCSKTAPPSQPPTNFLLFLGGLLDSLRTVYYPATIAAYLPPTWAVVEVQLSCSGAGWTTSNLAKDASELALATRYFHSLSATRNAQSLPEPEAEDGGKPGKIALMGHSTGAQISTHYLIGAWASPSPSPDVLSRTPIDGLILQAGISDREAVASTLTLDQLATSLTLAKDWIEHGRGGDILPTSVTRNVVGASPSAERWVSLVDEEGDDDFFSSDLEDERVRRVWGERGLAGRMERVCVLLGEKDEFMAEGVDKEGLLGRWEGAFRGEDVKQDGGVDDGGAKERKAVFDEASGVVENAGHNLNDSNESAVEDLCRRVSGFLERLGQ